MVGVTIDNIAHGSAHTSSSNVLLNMVNWLTVAIKRDDDVVVLTLL